MRHDDRIDDGRDGTPQPAVPDTVVATTVITIGRRLGRGGLGDVFEADDGDTGRSLAVKFLNTQAFAQQECREAFQFEATVTSQLEHPNIVPVYTTGMTPDGQLFYAMRLIQGRTFAAAIADFHDRRHAHESSEERSAQFTELLGQFALACKAIAYAHDRGVVHRDIKPANIMLGKFGEVVVLDWGLAARVDRDDRARSSGEQSILMPTIAVDEVPAARRGISGTPAYMSPEQHDGSRPVGLASDVYGLGATLYQLLAGQPPYDGDLGAIREHVLAGKLVPPSRVTKRVSRAIEAVCLKAMAHDPVDRYDSPLELARDVEHYVADLPVSAFREPILRKLSRWSRRHRRLAQMGIATMLVLALTAGTAAVLLRRLARDEYSARQTATLMAAKLAASAAALHIDARWYTLEKEAADPDLVAAIAALPAAGTPGDRPQWAPVQLALDAIAAEHHEAVDAESWTVCDATGTIIARSPMADTIGQSASHRDYFNGRAMDLPPGTSAKPVEELHCSTVYKSIVDERYKVSFSTPIRLGRHGDADHRCLGVLVMTFDVGSMFSSIDAIGGWNASRNAFSVAVIDLRDDLIDGTPKAGLVLENPELSHAARASRLEPQDERAPAEVVRRLRAIAGERRTTRGGERSAGFFDAEVPTIAGAEPIVIVGRPDRLAHIGWAVIVHER